MSTPATWGVVLIGMPGFEQQLARYPQLYIRVGFAHHYRPLDSKAIPQVLARYWQELGITYDPHRPSDAESVVAIVRITGGNFRLVERLMSQVARTMTINKLDTITPDAVEVAREVAVVGADLTGLTWTGLAWSGLARSSDRVSLMLNSMALTLQTDPLDFQMLDWMVAKVAGKAGPRSQ